jgi:outer membrane biosynthesis protein TonB
MDTPAIAKTRAVVSALLATGAIGTVGISVALANSQIAEAETASAPVTETTQVGSPDPTASTPAAPASKKAAKPKAKKSTRKPVAKAPVRKPVVKAKPKPAPKPAPKPVKAPPQSKSKGS